MNVKRNLLIIIFSFAGHYVCAELKQSNDSFDALAKEINLNSDQEAVLDGLMRKMEVDHTSIITLKGRLSSILMLDCEIYSITDESLERIIEADSCADLHHSLLDIVHTIALHNESFLDGQQSTLDLLTQKVDDVESASDYQGSVLDYNTMLLNSIIDLLMAP